jgi:hypothetical protein
MKTVLASPGSHALTTAALLGALALLVGCGGAGDTTDPDGHIRYTAPAGWEPVPASVGTRYRPADAPQYATIQVATITDDGEHDLAAEKDAWLEFQERSGHEVLANEEWSDAHHRGFAYAHTFEGNHGEGVWRHVLARGDGYRIAAHLQTTPDRHDADRAVFEQVLASIRPAR